MAFKYENTYDLPWDKQDIEDSIKKREPKMLSGFLKKLVRRLREQNEHFTHVGNLNAKSSGLQVRESQGNSADFPLMSLSADGSWHSLSMSSLSIPAGVTAALVAAKVNATGSTAPGAALALAPDASSQQAGFVVTAQVESVDAMNEGIVPFNSSSTFAYNLTSSASSSSLSWSAVSIQIKGWIV
jgi:hypothetical protein